MFTTNYRLVIIELATGNSRSILFHGGRALQSYLHAAFGTFADYYDIALGKPFAVNHCRYTCQVIREC